MTKRPAKVRMAEMRKRRQEEGFTEVKFWVKTYQVHVLKLFVRTQLERPGDVSKDRDNR